jgi:formylglycine-generating enzyme required for sulfatase activity
VGGHVRRLGPLAVLAALWALAALPAPAPALAQGPGAGDLEKNSLGVYFRLIPAGSFTMGAGPDFSGEAGFELPARRVSITRPFRLSVHEITRAQWLSVMGTEPSGKGDPRAPVANVSWEDVRIFIQKLSSSEGVAYRLPTEAEWEYAARAGTGTAWHFGSDPSALGGYAWCGESVESGRVRPVGQKSPNPWGLYDMYGNVAEWVSDWFGEDYYAQGPASDPKGPSGGTERSVRGGAYANEAQVCQSAWRAADLPIARSVFLGFRLASGE